MRTHFAILFAWTIVLIKLSNIHSKYVWRAYIVILNHLNWSQGLALPCISDESGSHIFNPGQVGSIFCGSDRVGSAIYGLGLNMENFP